MNKDRPVPTSPLVTASRLRELSRAASPGPWGGTFTHLGVVDGVGSSYVIDDPTADQGDLDLVVALRNDAEKYADLRDAAKALMDNVDSREKGLSGYYIDAQRFVALRAALAALGGEE